MSLREPLLAWAALLVLLAGNLLITLTGMPSLLGPWLNLACAAVMAGVVFVFYMGVLRLEALLRVFALSGFAWLAFMLFFTLADFLTR